MGYVDASFYVQSTVEKGMGPLIGKGVSVYLDDIFIYAVTFREFFNLLGEVFARLRVMRLRLKAEKCQVGVSTVNVLGHVFSRDGVCMGEERKSAVEAIPFPRSTKELRRFLGMANFMRRFIPRYAEISQPLSSQVNVSPSQWPDHAMRAAFAKVKEAIQKQLVLAHLDYSKAIVLSGDASIVGCGGYIGNMWYEDEERIVKVVACASHTFTDAEAKWKTEEQEGFVLLWLCMYFRHLLIGQPFRLETDHRNLTFIHGGTSPKLVRWSLALQNFRYTLVHVPGETQYVADTMSRTPAGRVVEDTDALRLSDFDANTPAANKFRLGAMAVVIAEEPKRRELYDSCHNATQGHHGLQRTLDEIRGLGYEWPRMSRDVAGWIAACAHCQKIRSNDLRPGPS